MAVVVIGRGIDISDRFARRPPQEYFFSLSSGDTASLMRYSVSLAVAIVFGLVNGWLIVSAEAPSSSRRSRQVYFSPASARFSFSPVDVVQWSPDLHSLVLDRSRRASRNTKASRYVRGCGGVDGDFLRLTRSGAFIYSSAIICRPRAQPAFQHVL